MNARLQNTNPEASNVSFATAANHQASNAMKTHNEQQLLKKELEGTSTTIGAESLLVAYDNEVRTSVVMSFCIAFVLVSIVELLISYPIYDVLVKSDYHLGTIVAIMMLLVGVVISHGFAKYLSKELDHHYLNEFKRGAEEEQLSSITARYASEKKRMLGVSIVLLVLGSLMIGVLSLERINYQENTQQANQDAPVYDPVPAEADTLNSVPTESEPVVEEEPSAETEASNGRIMETLFPLLLFIINSAFIGIFVPFYFKRRALAKKVKILKMKIEIREDEKIHHLELFKRNFRLAQSEEKYASEDYSINVREALTLYESYQTGSILS